MGILCNKQCFCSPSFYIYITTVNGIISLNMHNADATELLAMYVSAIAYASSEVEAVCRTQGTHSSASSVTCQGLGGLLPPQPTPAETNPPIYQRTN